MIQQIPEFTLVTHGIFWGWILTTETRRHGGKQSQSPRARRRRRPRRVTLLAFLAVRRGPLVRGSVGGVCGTKPFWGLVVWFCGDTGTGSGAGSGSGS